MANGWCPICGPVEHFDEDGCCAKCGATACGEGALKAMAQDATIAELRLALADARQRERERCADVARKFAARCNWYYAAALVEEIEREE